MTPYGGFTGVIRVSARAFAASEPRIDWPWKGLFVWDKLFHPQNGGAAIRKHEDEEIRTIGGR